MIKDRGFFHPTYNKRAVFFILLDVAVFYFSILLSFSIRIGYGNLALYREEILIYFSIISMCKIIFFLIFNIYAITWKYYSLKDVIPVSLALFFGQLISSIIIYIFFFDKYSFMFIPRSVFFLDFFISLTIVNFLRALRRLINMFIVQSKTEHNKVIVYGAGDGGEQIIRDMLREKSHYIPVAIIDDDKSKLRSKIHGIMVEGTLSNLPLIMQRYSAHTVIIAIPSMNKTRLQEVYDKMHSFGVKHIKILPSVEEILSDKITVKSLKELDIVDLIGREAFSIDINLIGNYLENKTVLVTGAGGSIGSEIVSQISRFNVGRIIALDIDETELFLLKNRIYKEYGVIIQQYLADIREQDSIKELFDNNRIDIVFHAAALKHVPLCEDFPYEAVKTNIMGTYNLIKNAENKVQRFILISTDKAVNPTSVMGATKRICEYIIKGLSSKSNTIYTAVRFGNVLGSRGSVIPLFKQQLETGGPITITHPDMRRYFMTIPEAVLLVIEAGAIAKGGEIFILDMGKPIYIKDIAERMIKMYGYEPGKDIAIKYTGIRPGEKLFEELLVDEEGIERTRFEKIMKAKQNNNYDIKFVQHIIKDFSNKKSKDAITKLLKKYISTFKYEE